MTEHSMEQARAIGEEQAQRAENRAERDSAGFGMRARAAIVKHLAEHGPSSGEDLTDACRAIGLTPKDDRAFGSAFGCLSRGKVIAVVGNCGRRKGHGTSGGRIWALSPPARLELLS